MVQLFTLERGRVSAIARGARKSQRRFGGTLEPMHELRVKLTERDGHELLELKESELATARINLVSHLETLEAAGRALGWLKRVLPEGVPEPALYETLDGLLFALNQPDASEQATLLLAEAGLTFLAEFGWALELTHCVACRRPCRPQQSALVDAARGGLICRACGGAALRLPGGTRERLIQVCRGNQGILQGEDVEITLMLVERALEHHAS